MTSQARKLERWCHPAIGFVALAVGLFFLLGGMLGGPITEHILLFLLLGIAVSGLYAFAYWLWVRWAGLDRAALSYFHLVPTSDESYDHWRRDAAVRGVEFVLRLLAIATIILGGHVADGYLPGRHGWAFCGSFILSLSLLLYPQYRRLWLRAKELLAEANRDSAPAQP